MKKLFVLILSSLALTQISINFAGFKADWIESQMDEIISTAQEVQDAAKEAQGKMKEEAQPVAVLDIEEETGTGIEENED